MNLKHRADGVKRSCRLVLLGGSLFILGLATESPLRVPASSMLSLSELFDEHSVHKFRIDLSPEAIAGLHRDSREYVPARLWIDRVACGQVGVHLKGSGTFQDLDEQPNLTVDLGRFSAEHKAGGVRKIHFNNSADDPSFLREWIGSELFRAAGVPTPRVSHAMVELNGRSLGLYVLKEGFSEEFLGRYFARGDGALSERVDGETMSGPAAASGGALQRLASAAQEPKLDRRSERLREILDLERFVSFLALEVVSCHWDGYALARNNYRIYHDPASDKLVFLPTGMDQIFANPKLTWHPTMSGLVARAFLDTPDGQRLFRERVVQLTDLHPARLRAQIEQKISWLRSAIGGKALVELREEADRLSRQIAERQANLRRELAQSGPELLPPLAEGLLLTSWYATDCPAQGTMLEERHPEENAPTHSLHTVAGPRTSASWRCPIRLAKGQYRFQALVRTREVMALPFGKNQGARLRVSGTATPPDGLLGTHGWESLQVDFEVRDEDALVELICELRARGGEAWWSSCHLRRVDS